MTELRLLREVEDRLAASFAAERAVLSFDEYFATVLAAPAQSLRSSAQYLRDCFDYFGTTVLPSPAGPVQRWNLFDAPWSNGRERVIGQEPAQAAIYRILQNFIRERRVTRLVMLHGPNGSAKSLLIDCISAALEHYSIQNEGAIYRFNWVFPSTRSSKRRLGFGPSDERPALDSFAHLDDDAIDARLPADLRDHPLLLLPASDRRALLDRLHSEGKLPSDEAPAEVFSEGDLAPRSRAIFDALLNAYHGDLQRVLQHVQVTRFSFSRRYRQALVTVEPQLHVDAQIRQVTVDKALGSLPPALRTLSLFEPFGDLVDANRGLINYNDLLKKPIDAFKYLLATCEKGTVALPNAILHLDCLFLASSNETHLQAFKEYADFASFKGRMDLVPMPYLRSWEAEQAIYDAHLAHSGVGATVVPHATWVLAAWATLTRLKRPNPASYPPRIREAISRLTPWDKALLYAQGEAPRALSAEETRELLAALGDLLSEDADAPNAEGFTGASPRELKQLLLNALQRSPTATLTPLAVLEELRTHVKLRSVYEYLQAKVDHGYHDAAAFIDLIEARWLDRVDDELRQATGLVDEQRYEELFARYLLNVTYAQKKEKLYNEKTGTYDPPDVELMAELERNWEIGSGPERFRSDLVARVGAWRVEHPGDAIPWRRLFPKLIEQLEQAYYTRQKARVRRELEACLTTLAADHAGEDPVHHGLAVPEVKKARETLEQLQQQRGYPTTELREVLAALFKARY